MDLGTYLEARQILPTHFAEKLGVKPSTITRIIRRERKPSLDLAARIEEMTAGEVSCRDLAMKAPSAFATPAE